MQVVAAPLTAISAYALFAPDATEYAALIGFTSGFASEPILMRVREMAKTIGGTKKKEAAPKALEGNTPVTAAEEPKG